MAIIRVTAEDLIFPKLKELLMAFPSDVAEVAGYPCMAGRIKCREDLKLLATVIVEQGLNMDDLVNRLVEGFEAESDERAGWEL